MGSETIASWADTIWRRLNPLGPLMMRGTGKATVFGSPVKAASISSEECCVNENSLMCSPSFLGFSSTNRIGCPMKEKFKG